MNDEIIYSDTWTSETIEDVKKLSGPILIVGASGFIGAKLYFSLNKIRDDVYACSKNPLNCWRLINVHSPKILNVDITDFEALKNAINTIRPMTVFNLAAYGAYARQSDTERIHQTNYIGTLNLLRALSDTGCSAFVQAGTSSEYGLNSKFADENGELIPNSDYAVSKVGAGYIVKYYGRILNFPCANLRLFSIFGPWEEKDRLIPTLIASGLKGVYPNFVDRSIARDFVYIDDCTGAIVRAALTVCKTNPGISINVASGVKTTMEDVARTAKKMFNISSEPEFGSMMNRKWDITEWYGNPQLAEKLMGWKCRTSFEDGLKLNIEWERKTADMFKYVSPPSKPKKISAVIACYKDSRSIPVLHERLTNVFRQTGNDYEIIFVNDSSPDNDYDVIKDLCEKDAHVLGISHSRNFGSQSAFMSGMEIASGHAVVLMDGDGQDPPEIIADFVKKWEDGYDIVYGQRTKRDASFYMQFLYKLFYRIFRKLSDINVPVDAGDFSLMDRKVVDHLLKFTEKDIFLRGLRAWVGFRQTGVPYTRPERLFGRSTNNFSKNIWWAKKGIFSFSMKPLYYIQSLGTLIFFITILLSAYYLINFFINPPSARGITTIVLLVLGLGSIQIISISIVGDYIGKITEEVKNRPKFIRDKIIYNGKVYDSEENIMKIIEKIGRTRA
ncbi:MAG: NAD-dependent epimerase/dehydratase family protein [Victivallaceae bacterium]|jgi:dolichol-phosphate mannosyltransferase